MKKEYSRFCDLFTSYEIGLRGIKNKIPFLKLPFYRKIFAVLFFFEAIFAFVLTSLNSYFVLYIFALMFITLLLFLIIDSQKKNLEIMLEKYYKPYSQKRMELIISILNQYKIDINDKETIDLLIEEAIRAQSKCDYLAPFEKPFKTLGAVTIPVIIYVVKKYSELLDLSELINTTVQYIVIILLCAGVVFVLIPFIKDIFYRDYKKYGEMIYDLRQVKLFCSQK